MWPDYESGTKVAGDGLELLSLYRVRFSFISNAYNNREVGMWKAALAGAMLATVGVTCASAQTYETASYEQGQVGESGQAGSAKVVTAGHIARLKAALHLTAAQLHYWPAVESALRGLSHRQSKDHSGDGVARRIAAAAIDANALRRVVTAAGPLIGSLDEKQRQEGLRVIRALGFSSLAAAL
jgi:hypothetical protein